VAEKWAEECAGYEQRGTSDYVKATLVYERRFEVGWSPLAIAGAVADAGFRIAPATVKRRLAALTEARKTNARANSKAFLEAFSDAYMAENRKARGEHFRSVSVPANSLQNANRHVRDVVEYIQGDNLTPLDRQELPALARRIQAGIKVILDAVENNVPISGDWDAALAELEA
jgi:hypothetical protein